MKKEITASFAVTLGTLAIASPSHAEDSLEAGQLPEPIATRAIAPTPVALSTIDTAKPTLDRATILTPTPEFSPPKSSIPTEQTLLKLNPLNPNSSNLKVSPLKEDLEKSTSLNTADLNTADRTIQITDRAQPTNRIDPIPLSQLTNPIQTPDRISQTPDRTSQTDIQELRDNQTKLEQELESLKQQIKQQATQQNTKPEVKPHPDLPDGLQIYSEAIFLKPRSDLMMDFARVDPGSTFLATGGPIAALDYRESTAWRVNARYRFAKSPWEVGASFTRLGSDDAAIATQPNGGFLFATLTAPRGGSASADTAIATAKIDYTVTDFDAAYHIQPSNTVDLKLIAGLRIANIGQNMSAVYTGGSFDPIPGTFQSSQQFRGLGPRAGAEARVAIGSGFSIYGRGSGSLLFGDQESDVVETFQGVPVADFKVNRKQTVPVIDAAIGVDWSTKLGQTGKFTIGLGYEYQHWFNLTRNVRYTDASAPGGFVENKGDLSMQGFFAKAGLSWTF